MKVQSREWKYIIVIYSKTMSKYKTDCKSDEIEKENENNNVNGSDRNK